MQGSLLPAPSLMLFGFVQGQSWARCASKRETTVAMRGDLGCGCPIINGQLGAARKKGCPGTNEAKAEILVIF